MQCVDQVSKVRARIITNIHSGLQHKLVVKPGLYEDYSPPRNIHIQVRVLPHAAALIHVSRHDPPLPVASYMKLDLHVLLAGVIAVDAMRDAVPARAPPLVPIPCTPNTQRRQLSKQVESVPAWKANEMDCSSEGAITVVCKSPQAHASRQLPLIQN